ncbi:DUF1735 domain-containing protein [Pedobacter sp. N36a]|uniref:DUF1735 domain-containing protein n=1 Tax=Pedobacter sp. N36a TaxID=2767996 RepID=UPI0016576490|nr:DUF1735 domain-containing protein [Pedobacter sp. N36a]MBC8988013.1 DUF1735 domain-containing protein [Pedobacter sp. N36a]
MKKYLILFLAVLSVSACKDTRFDDMIPDSIYLPKSDLQAGTITVMNEDNYTHEIWIHKAGYFQGEFDGSLSLDATYLDTYNESHNTDYEMLNEKYFTLEKDFEIAAAVNETSVPLMLKVADIVKDHGYGTYYIPLRINSRTEGGKVNVEKSNLILAITLKQPILTIDSEKKGVFSLDFSTNAPEKYELNLTAKLDVKSPTDLSVSYATDLSLLSVEEKALDTKYYSFKDDLTIPSGEQYAESFLILDVAKMPRGKWVIPVRLMSSNTKVKVDESAYVKLTISKGNLDDIKWTGDYFQQNEIIVPSQLLNDKVIATAEGVEIEISSDQSWANVTTKADGKIYLNVNQVNSVNHRERFAKITVVDKSTKLTKTINVRQCAPGYGTLLNRKLWSIAAYSANAADKSSQLNRLYNGIWPSNASEDTYLELNNRVDGSTPFVLTFDMGEGHKQYNSLGLMPRLQWTQPAPKRVKIEVSDNNVSWTTLGPNSATTGMWDAFTEAELKGSTDSWNNHWEGMVHWFDFGMQSKRYIRISLYESWYQTTGKVLCLNQMFVSQR